MLEFSSCQDHFGVDWKLDDFPFVFALPVDYSVAEPDFDVSSVDVKTQEYKLKSIIMGNKAHFITLTFHYHRTNGSFVGAILIDGLAPDAGLPDHEGLATPVQFVNDKLSLNSHYDSYFPIRILYSKTIQTTDHEVWLQWNISLCLQVVNQYINYLYYL